MNISSKENDIKNRVFETVHRMIINKSKNDADIDDNNDRLAEDEFLLVGCYLIVVF